MTAAAATPPGVAAHPGGNELVTELWQRAWRHGRDGEAI